MEITPCAQDVGLYAASLLKYLNLQREQGQFCDCVLRQNSDQIYPAHRCVLAASSPVLATILSSTGVLVELQDWCLSGSVMASLLDYIYTGLLPSPLNQQQYYKLFAVAGHLQMKELQEALRAARRQVITEDISNTSNGAGDLSLSPKTESFRQLEEISAQYSSNVETLEEVKINTASTVSRVKNLEKYCNRLDAKTLNSDAKIHANDESEVSYFAQGLMQNDHVSSEVCHVPEANQGVYEHQYNVNGFANAEVCKRSTEETLQWTSEGRRRSSSSSSTSQHPCCGVPVICHSRRASVLQMADVCEASQSSISSSMMPVSRSSSIENDNTVKERKDQEGEQNHKDSRNQNKQTACITHPELNNYHSSSHVNQSITNDNEPSCNGFTHNTDHTSQHALSDSMQSKINHLREDLSQNEYLGKILKHQLKSDFDSFPSKHRCLDCFECNVKLTREMEEQIKDRGAVVLLPVQDSETGSDSNCEDGEYVEVKEEHESSSRSLTETDIQDSHCNQYEPETNWSLNISEAEKDTASIQQEYKSNSTSTSSESGLDDATNNLCVFNNWTSPEHREISGTKTTEPCLYSTTCVDNMPDPMSGSIDQLYHGHLHYQWLPHQGAHLSIQSFAHKYSSHNSDSADEEEANSFFALSGQRPLMQLFSENTDQVLLLDINTKPTELLVTFKHRSESEEEEVILRDAEEVRNPDKTQTNTISPSEGFGGINREGNVEEKDSLEDQCRTGAAQNAAVMEVSISNEGEAKISTCSVSSPSQVPDSVQTSSLSVCKPFSLPADRSAHLSSPHHQPFQCSLCDRSFSQRGSLNRHVRSHLGVRPFPCPRCPMTFSRQYRVTEHMRVHQRCALGSVFQKPSDSFIKDNEERPQH